MKTIFTILKKWDVDEETLSALECLRPLPPRPPYKSLGWNHQMATSANQEET